MTAAIWQGSPNFSPNRDGHKLGAGSWIVLHTTVGTAEAARSRFQNAAQQASSHYLVRLDGTVWQFVHEADAAWTNGTYAGNPGSNLDSVTIEHEDGGAYNGPRTPALYAASSALVNNISQRYGIPLVHRGAGGGILAHKECGPTGQPTSCPDSLDIARIITGALALRAGTATGKEDSMVFIGPRHAGAHSLRVYTAGNVYAERSTEFPVVRALGVGTTVSVDAYCYSSVSVNSPDLGNGQPGADFCWWHLADGSGWVPDAILDTTPLGAAMPPATSTEATRTLWAVRDEVAAAAPDDDSAYVRTADLPAAVKAALAGSSVQIPAVTVQIKPLA